MKKLYILLLFSISLNAQVIAFPDNVFKTKLLSADTSNGLAKNNLGQNIKIDINNNGEIELTEALLVYELNLSTSNINDIDDIFDLTGILNFQNLKILNCNGNQLTSLDFSSLSNLEEIYCNSNDLINLVVANLGQLKSLECSNNIINELDLSGLVSLETLKFNANGLSSTNLDFNETPNLSHLECYINNISTLNVSMLPQLKHLECDTNNMLSLNIENLGLLEEVHAFGNSISEINLEGLDALRYLNLSDNNISDINVLNLNNLNYFNISYNPISVLNCDGLLNLTDLQVIETLVSELNCSQTGVRQLFCNNNPNLVTINTRNNIISYSDPDLLYFIFDFDNLPILESICMDDDEVYNLNYTDYNSNENVLIYTGENCDVLTEVPPLNVDSFESLSFKIYPNPTQNSFSISTSSSVNISKVTIYNSIGQHLKSFSTDKSNFDISDFMSGIYFVKIETDQGSINERIIKK